MASEKQNNDRTGISEPDTSLDISGEGSNVAAPQRSSKAGASVEEFETANLSRLLLKFAIPSVIGLLCNGIQNIVNRIFVGHAVGSVALAAVTIAFPIMNVFMAFGMLVGIGSMTLIAIRLGQRRDKEAEVILGQATLLSFVVPLVVYLLMLPFLDQILVLIGATDTVLPYARDYTKIFLFGMIFFTPSASINNIIRAQGAPGVAMGTQILASLLNVLFNYLFVMVLGWGVKGAALGIVLGNGLSLFWVFGFFCTKHSYLKIRRENLRIRRNIIGKVAILGISPFLMQLAATLQNLILNISLSHLGGDTALATISIIMALSTILTLPMVGINAGMQPIVGYCYGAKIYKRVHNGYWIAVLYATIFAILGFVIVQVWAVPLTSIFTSNEPEVVAMASHALRIYFIFLPVIGFGMVSGAYLQALGKPIQAAVMSLSRQVLMFIPALLILPLFFGLEGCWYAAPVSDALSTFLNAGFIIWIMKRLKKEERGEIVGNQLVE